MNINTSKNSTEKQDPRKPRLEEIFPNIRQLLAKNLLDLDDGASMYSIDYLFENGFLKPRHMDKLIELHEGEILHLIDNVRNKISKSMTEIQDIFKEVFDGISEIEDSLLNKIAPFLSINLGVLSLSKIVFNKFFSKINDIILVGAKKITRVRVIAIIENELEKILLERKAMRDQLTGLYNRNYLEDSKESLLSSIKRERDSKDIAEENKSELVVFSLDLNRLKSTNDQYGHDAGDALLTAFADLLKQVFRKSDLIFRFGGDEFLVITKFKRGKTRRSFNAEINRKVKSLKEKMRESLFEFTGKSGGRITLQISSSVGYSSSFGVEIGEDTLQELIKIADKNMYADKGTTRTRENK